MKKYGLISLLIFCMRPVHAQDNGAQAISAIKQLTEAYMKTNYIGFDMSYYYADEKKPGLWLDSLKGSCKINNGRYWYMLDSTEMLYGDKYVVICYKEDKVMYLSKPSAALQQRHPLAALDSALQSKQGWQYGIVNTASEKIITILPGKATAWKKLQYFIDAGTGLLTKMVTVVSSEQLYDSSVWAQLDDSGSYAIIEVRFSGYHTNDYDEKDFDTGRYFTRQGSGYATTPAYNHYKIFLGNTGL